MCVTLALGLIFQSSVLEYIVRPVALAYWAAWRIILSINQEIYWSGLIILGLLLALRLVPKQGKAVSRYQYQEHPKPVPDVEKWYCLLTSAPYQASNALEVNENLLRLFASLSDLNDGNEREATKLWKEKLPPGTFALLHPDRRKAWKMIHLWAQRLALPFTKQVRGERSYYDAVEGALNLIEFEMENQNDKFQNS